jgi:stage II sporulation protein D
MADECESKPAAGPEHATRWGKPCAALAATVAVVAPVLLALSCCPLHRAVPKIPPLPPAPAAVRAPASVNVVLAQAPTMTVRCAEGGTWYVGPREALVALADGGTEWVITAPQGMLVVNERPLGVQAAQFRPTGPVLQLDGTGYRGWLEVSETAGRVRAVNVIDPQTYLRAVVGSEMYARWPMNTLMAQAVAARTYLFFTHGRKGYVNTSDMAYQGVSAENHAADLAVELTDDIVLTHNGQLFSAYFHSTCGGHTAAAAKVFDDVSARFLTGVPCEWCRASPAYTWTARLPQAEAARRLQRRDITAITSLDPLGSEPDGHAQDILVNHSVRMGAQTLRLALGSHTVKSTCFTASATADGLLFRGRGFGHGVGMCQWGAFGMAQAGRDWQEILAWYYPGTSLKIID